jgi:signal transduction histidine kinase
MTYGPRSDAQSLFIGAVFLAVAAIDTLHLLTDDGMPVYLNTWTPSIPAYAWVLGRFTMAFGLLVAFRLPSDRIYGRVSPPLTLFVSVLYAAGVIFLLSFYVSSLPPLGDHTEGLRLTTSFYEYVIIAVLIMVGAVYWRSAFRASDWTHFYILCAVVLAIFGEMSLTLPGVEDCIVDLVGHLFVAASFVFVMWALFRSSVLQPYEQLWRTKGILERRTIEAEAATERARTYLDFLSHDITNILTPIMTYGEMLSLSDDSSPRTKKFSAKIMSQADRATQFITNLRRFSRAESAAAVGFDDFDLEKALVDAEAETRGKYPHKKMNVRYVLPAEKPMLAVGAGHIEVLISEIFDNAVKHSVADSVEIEVTVSEKGRTEEGPQWKIEIADNGPGVPDFLKDGLMAGAFDDAHTLSRGIASALCFMSLVAEQVGGRLYIVDRVLDDSSKGTKVVLILPKAE